MMENKKEITFIEFIKKSKVSILIIIGFLLFAFGERLINNGFGIDVEYYLYNVNNNGNWEWLFVLNRWAIVLINKVFMLDTFVVWVSNYMTTIMMFVYSMLFNYLFYIHMKEENKEKFIKYQFIFPILFLTNPIFAEQYNFIHQGFAVAVGIACIPLSLILVHKASEQLEKTKKIVLYVIAIATAVLAFGVYQSIILLYVAAVASCYLMKVMKDNNNNFKYLGKQIGMFAIAAIAYTIICRLTGETSSYLQMGWTDSGILQCIRNIGSVVKEVIKCDGIFYNVGYLFAIVLTGVLGMTLIIKKKMKIGIMLGMAAVLIAPFYIMIITGVDQMIRTQFNYSYVIGFLLMLFTVAISGSQKKKIAIYGCATLALILAYRQSYATAELFHTDHIRYENDVSFAKGLDENIKQKTWYDANKEYSLVIVGEHSNKAKNMYLKEEIIGYSFFDFDYEIDQRATIFMNVLSYDYKVADNSVKQTVREYVRNSDIESYPKEDSIFLYNDNTIVVRLSQEV